MPPSKKEPSTSTAQRTDTITPDLPSTVDNTLAACPQFRIVLVGNTGVGKSSLVSNVFNISLDDIDVAHDRAGRANINHGYTCDENPRFVLHDSQGFEAGSLGTWETAQKFLRERSRKTLPDQVHAIWLCIQAPREGSRVGQTGDEKLLSLAQELKIPVIIVFTKYDDVVNEQEYTNAEEHGCRLSQAEILKNAETCFNNRIKEFKAKQASIVKVSTHKDYPQRLQTLRELTDVTRKCLGDTEEGALVPWVTAQRISAHQKVETSISEGFKKYWLNLGQSVFFQGHALEQCVRRIHDDILKVWNFNDPEKLLYKKDFFKKMFEHSGRVLRGHEGEIQEVGLSEKPPLNSSATETSLVAGSATTEIGFKFLYGIYQMIPLTARYIGLYIVDLTCILHRLFLETLRMEPPRTVSEELISKVVKDYKETESSDVQKRVLAMNVIYGFEDKIKDLLLKPTDTDYLPQDTGNPQPVTHRTPDRNTSKASPGLFGIFSCCLKGG